MHTPRRLIEYLALFTPLGASPRPGFLLSSRSIPCNSGGLSTRLESNGAETFIHFNFVGPRASAKYRPMQLTARAVENTSTNAKGSSSGSATHHGLRCSATCRNRPRNLLWSYSPGCKHLQNERSHFCFYFFEIDFHHRSPLNVTKCICL